jgi:23S rRNA (uracil1939-C5)-methyltransferase
LPERISKSIKPLKDLLKNLSIFNKIPQIEYASNQKRDIFIFRILDQLSKDDINKFEQFQSDFNIEVWVQEKGPETAKPLFHDQQEKKISYRLNEFNLNIEFDPTGFIQINPFINELMITKAIELLDLSSEDIVSDFFSGLGNFTLPIAKFANRVEGVEGSEQLVKLGEANAKLNGLNNIQFTFQNLFELNNQYLKRHKQSNKWLIDPPRDGAMQLIQLISPDTSQPNKIVYISCNPATFARDANILVFEKGYKFKGSGILNMFPNTSHIESISVFEYGK